MNQERRKNMDLISAAFVPIADYREPEQALIRAVAKTNGFFGAITGDKIDLSAYMSADEAISTLLSGRGGVVVIAQSHPDFDLIRSRAGFEWHNRFRYEFDVFGHECGFCHECRGSTADGQTFGTCFDCQALIMNDEPPEPRKVAKAFKRRKKAWERRHTS